MIKYKVVLEPQEEGGFTAVVPNLPGCVSEGDTEEEAVANIRDAICCYLDACNCKIEKEHPEAKVVEVEV